MSQMPAVNFIDPLSPSALQNTMGASQNLNETAARQNQAGIAAMNNASAERQQQAALTQDSAEKAKYQQFLAAQQASEQAAQRSNLEYTTQAQQQFAREQEARMYKVKEIQARLESSRAARRAAAIKGDQAAIEAANAAEQSDREQLNLLEQESAAAEHAITQAGQENDVIRTGIDQAVNDHVANVTALRTSLSESAATAVGAASAKLAEVGNLDLALEGIHQPKGVGGALSMTGSALMSPVKTLTKAIPQALNYYKSNPAGSRPLQATDEERGRVILGKVAETAADTLASQLGDKGNRAEVQSATKTLFSATSLFAAAATPEERAAALDQFEQAKQKLIQSAPGVSEYELKEYLSGVASSMERTATSLPTNRNVTGDNAASRNEDIAKGFKTAASFLRNTVNTSMGNAPDPLKNLLSTHTITQGYAAYSAATPEQRQAILAQVVRGLETVKNADLRDSLTRKINDLAANTDKVSALGAQTQERGKKIAALKARSDTRANYRKTAGDISTRGSEIDAQTADEAASAFGTLGDSLFRQQ